jgi:hypothetical protein
MFDIVEWGRKNPQEVARMNAAFAKYEGEEDCDILVCVEMGWLEYGVDQDGNLITVAVRDDNNPIWLEHKKGINHTLSQLVEDGLIEIHGVAEDGDYVFTLTDEGRELAQNANK